jgi:MinD superfamily P-loop ATPase
MTEGNGPGLYWVGGSKGGVGKSIMTVAMLDYVIEQQSKAVLVECDTSNPNVWKAHREQVEAELINLDEAYGWIHLVNTCDRRARRSW